MVESVKGGTRLVLSVKIGVDPKGADLRKSMNFSKVKTTAADENLFATAKAIEPLLRYQVLDIGKDDFYTLCEV